MEIIDYTSLENLIEIIKLNYYNNTQIADSLIIKILLIKQDIASLTSSALQEIVNVKSYFYYDD